MQELDGSKILVFWLNFGVNQSGWLIKKLYHLMLLFLCWFTISSSSNKWSQLLMLEIEPMKLLILNLKESSKVLLKGSMYFICSRINLKMYPLLKESIIRESFKDFSSTMLLIFGKKKIKQELLLLIKVLINI